MNALYSFIFVHFILLVLFEIPNDNVFKRLYDLILTAIFIQVQLMICYPYYVLTNDLTPSAILFVIWLVVLIISNSTQFLTNLTGKS